MTVTGRWGVPVLAVTAVALAGALTAQADHGHDLDCSDFPSQASAQQHMEAHPGDPDGLDGSDGDGRACESNACPCDHEASAPRPAQRHRGRVASVVDGDTLTVRLRRSGRRRTLRLIGIDTPESRKPGVPVECGAREATAHMRRLALARGVGVRVNLTGDPTQSRTDAYGRLLSYVDRRSDGRDLGRAMVRAGWAAVYVHDDTPFRRLGSYARVQRAAQAAGRGVFGRCDGDFHSEQ